MTMPMSQMQPIALRLMRTDLPRVQIKTPMREAAEILRARAASGAGASNPILVVCSGGDDVFEGFISLMDVLRWMQAGGHTEPVNDGSDDAPSPGATVESQLRHNVVKLHVQDTLDTILSGIANSAAGGCPVMDGHRLLGVILVEDVFTHIAGRLLVEDLDHTDG